jgi:RecA/RadA recombinase
MAKKENFTLQQMLSEIKSEIPVADKIKYSKFSQIKDWIPTGNYMLNLCLSGDMFKGIPSGRITAIAGDSGTGKTFLMLNISREAQALGYKVLYFDTENAIEGSKIDENGNVISDSPVSKFGIDTENFIHIPITTTGELIGIVSRLIDKAKKAKRSGGEYEKIFIACDSLGMIASDKEKEDAISGNDKVDMTRAKNLRKFFRIITNDIGELGWPFVFTNHTYGTMDMFSQKKMGGGEGLIYAASSIIFLSKGKEKDIKTNEQVGIKVFVDVQKNRFAIPKKFTMQILFNSGMNPYVGIHEYVNWERCGIESGKLEEKFIEKPVLDENGEPVIYRGKPKTEKVSTGEFEFIPSSGGQTIAVKHLGENIKKSHPKRFFSSEVFNQEILNTLNEYLKPIFSYSGDMENDLDELFDEDDLLLEENE